MKKSFLFFRSIAFLIFIISLNSFGDNQWISIGPVGGLVSVLVIDPQRPDILYAGTNGGVFKSTNGGMNWTAMNTGLGNTFINALAIDPQTSDTLYTGTDGDGVFKIQQDTSSSIGIFRGGVWCLDMNGNGQWDGLAEDYVCTFGLPTDIPVAGDWNGDGKMEIAVYHVPTNQWFVKGMGNLGQCGWGGWESFPIPGDYNGDGVMERGFYRPSENRWFIGGESDFVWGWGGTEFMPITSHIAVYNWFRFMLGRFQ